MRSLHCYSIEKPIKKKEIAAFYEIMLTFERERKSITLDLVEDIQDYDDRRPNSAVPLCT